MRKCIISCVFFGIALSSPASYAQDTAKLRDLMNVSEICKPLVLNTSVIRTLIPYPIPSIIPDADIGIDKDRHEVTAVEITATTAKITGVFGCQPSDKGVPFQAPFNENPDNWRITDKFECTAQITEKVVSSMACTTSGAVGQALAAAFNINDKMKSVLQTYLQT